MVAAEAIYFKEFITNEDHPLERYHEIRRELHCHVDLRTQLEELLADFDKLVKDFSSENKAEIRRSTCCFAGGRILPKSSTANSTRGLQRPLTSFLGALGCR